MDAVQEYSMTIGGKAVSCPRRMAVINPATEGVIADVPDAGVEQLDVAVAAARAAQPGWAARPLAERQELLRAIGQCLLDHVDTLAAVLTAEQGKPLPRAKGEIMGAASWFTRTATMELPIEVSEDSPLRRAETRHVPLGVVGIIVPWNFPVLLASVKVAPALLAGNAVIWKPSPFTPLASLRIADLLRDILPPGVLNIVTGDDALGPLVTAHPGIDKISFTGSTATGKKVMASAAERLTRITLELGGNDAAIILPDVDVDTVAETLFASAFTNSGQICIATKRMFVHDAIYHRLAAAFVAIAGRTRMGDGSVAGTDLGPIQNRPQYERVRALIADSKAAGHRFLVGGETGPAGKGYFVPITIIDNPPDDSRVVREEAFGPVLPLLRFHTIDDAIKRANDSEFGLGGSVWSADIAVATQIAARLKTGTVWINELQNISPYTVFAGHGQSGLGAENGLAGLLEYTCAQTILVSKTAPVAA